MAEQDAPGRSRLTIGRGWAVYIGPVEPGRLHQHQAAQLAWSPQGPLRLEGAWGAIEAPGHLVRAGVPHCLVATQPLRLVFLDPSMQGAVSSRSLQATAAALTTAQVALLERELAHWLVGTPPSPAEGTLPVAAGDQRWATVLQWLDQALDGRVRVEDAAAVVGLSSSRFMHWFSEAAGLPLRAYVRWLRLQRAVRTVSAGATLTDAAHLAGFADSAHLTRTFVATFGVRPASLRQAQIVCADHGRPPLTPDGQALVDLL